MNKLTSGFAGLVTALGIAAWSVPSFADPIADDNLDPLWAFCYGNTSCTNNGTVTPTASSNQYQFGFYISPSPITADFAVDILVPINEDSTPSAVSYSIGVSHGGATDQAPFFSATASLFSTTPWKGGHLSDYLGITLAPTAPTDGISQWLPSTQEYDPGATGRYAGYYVYQVDLGITALQAAKKELLGPELELDQALPEGSLIVGYLNLDNSGGAITTQRTGALLIDSVPEPGSLAIFGVALLSLAAAYRSKRA